MLCLRMAAAASACLGIMPGVACASPHAQVYATVDGAWFALSASTQEMTAQLFRSLDRPELIEDPRFRTNADRLKHVEELDAIVQDFVGQHTLDSNLAFFAAVQVTVGLVYDAASFGDDPHVQARGVLVEMEDAELGSVPMHAVCPRFSHTPGALRRPAPDLGQHDEEVLTSLPPREVQKRSQKLRTGVSNPVTADPCPVGDQNE